MWYLTRSSGIVAMILAVAALVWGFLFSARETGKRLRPNWWLDLHNWLGGLALIFTGIHIGAAFLDTASGIGIVQVFVPGTAALDAWAIGWGVIAAYLFAATLFTTWPRRLGHRRLWRVVHLSSVVGTALALLHTYQSGSDATTLVMRIGLLAGVAVATYALGLRLFGLPARRRSRRPRSGEVSDLSADAQVGLTRPKPGDG